MERTVEQTGVQRAGCPSRLENTIQPGLRWLAFGSSTAGFVLRVDWRGDSPGEMATAESTKWPVRQATLHGLWEVPGPELGLGPAHQKMRQRSACGGAAHPLACPLCSNPETLEEEWTREEQQQAGQDGLWLLKKSMCETTAHNLPY